MRQIKGFINYVDWMGVNVVDQSTADFKIPELLDTPTSIRFVVVDLKSLVGPINLVPYLMHNAYKCNCSGWHETEFNITLLGYEPDSHSPQIAICEKCNERALIFRGIDLVFLLGELPENRPSTWARNIQKQCDRAHIPVFEINHKER